jgi:hypothetical protein
MDKKNVQNRKPKILFEKNGKLKMPRYFVSLFCYDKWFNIKL